MEPRPVLNESFHVFSETAQRIAETRSTNAKMALAAAYFATLEPEALRLAVRFFSEGAFSSVSGRRAAVGGATVGRTAAAFCEIDYDAVFAPCRAATGSSSEAIEKLCANLDAPRAKMSGHRLTLEDLRLIFERLYETRSRAEKEEILASAWRMMSPLEVKYFLRILGGGSLRIGFDARSVLNAVADAFGQDAGEVRHTHMLTGSAGETALLSARGVLDQARFRLFHPVAFMLASPLESRSIEDVAAYIAEEKFDGMRCQLHANGSRVALFSRDLNDVTGAFPDLATDIARRGLTETVLDGEIVVFDDDRIQPFQRLQQRMGVKSPTAKLLARHPVRLIAFDVLYAAGRTVVQQPLEWRRTLLEEIARTHGLALSEQFKLEHADDVQRLYDRAVRFGNEGLVLKQRGSRYAYGERGGAWLKVKQPGGSIDTVILYATKGSGKRGGIYSDFTLGIRVDDDERFEEAFVPIGKAYGGYSNEEMRRLNRAIRPLIRERFGPTLALEPGIVVELEFDSIQVNRRTKAKYTLRLPRFRAIRWDRSPSDINTLRDVEAMYRQQVERTREAQGAGHQSFR